MIKAGKQEALQLMVLTNVRACRVSCHPTLLTVPMAFSRPLTEFAVQDKFAKLLMGSHHHHHRIRETTVDLKDFLVPGVLRRYCIGLLD